MEEIDHIKHEGNHITAMLSYADLIQLGGYAAVEYCGGPSMIFKMGRVDTEEEPQHDLLPDVHENHSTVLDKM